MATYIPGITDYVPQIQPFSPDYNFLGNVLQTRQSRYDSAHKKLNGIYGTILNSPLTRDSNIKRRDEFFKAVDGDIKRISGLDLSLEQNVNQAMTVFKPFYEDKDIMNDMAQTKQYIKGIEKHERLKDCSPPEKCGGQAWDYGAAELNYKREEFKNMSDADALKFQMPSYSSYFNWEKEAVELAKAADLNVEQDSITGQWIVHDSNGTLVSGGLMSIFKNTYGNDPRVTANYNTKAYVDGKSYISNPENIQKHGSAEAAESFYLTEQIKAFDKNFGQASQDTDDDVEEVTVKKRALEKKSTSPQGITDEEQQILESLGGVHESLVVTKKSIDDAKSIVNNPSQDANLESLRRKGLTAAANNLMGIDIYNMAGALSLRNKKHTVSVNPYGMEAVQQSNRKEMKALDFEYDKAKMSAQLNMNLSEMEMKYLYENGMVPGGKSDEVITALPDEGLSTELGTVQQGIKRDVGVIDKLVGEAQSGNGKVMYDIFNRAKIAASTSIGANNYLKSVFGPSWTKIKTEQDMENAIKTSGRSLEGAFNHSMTVLNGRTAPGKDNTWAQDYLNDNKTHIQDVKIKNQAAAAVIDSNLKISQGVINSIQKSAVIKDIPAYKDADLLLSGNGIPMIDDVMPVQFAANYMRRHGSDKYSDAKDAYEVLKDKYVEQYGQSHATGLNKGYGLSGGGSQKPQAALSYSSVNSKSYGSKGAMVAKNVLGTLVPNSNSYQVVFGKPTADNIAESDPALMEGIKPFLGFLLSDMRSTTKGTKGVQFDMEEHPVAGNETRLSALTLKLKPEYLEDSKYIGTKEKPGVLWNYRDALANGISLVYDNTKTPTVTNTAMQTSDLQYIARHKGIAFTEFPKATTDAKITYDGTSGQYRFNGSIKYFDPQSGKWGSKPTSELIQESKLDPVYENLNTKLAALHDDNMRKELWYTANKKQASNTK